MSKAKAPWGDDCHSFVVFMKDFLDVQGGTRALAHCNLPLRGGGKFPPSQDKSTGSTKDVKTPPAPQLPNLPKHCWPKK